MKTITNEFIETMPTVETIGNLALLENIFQSIFLKGSNNIHFHPEQELLNLSKYLYNVDFLRNPKKSEYNIYEKFQRHKIFSMLYRLYSINEF